MKKNENQKTVLKKFEWSVRESVLATSLALIICIFIYTAVKNTWKLDGLFGELYTVIVSVLCSILSTAALPKVLQSAGTSDIQNMIKQEISNGLGGPDSSLEKIMHNEIEVLVSQYSQMSPMKIFTDTDTPNPEFNTLLNNSITNSENYVFFSDRAMFTAKRLWQYIDKKYANPNLSIKVFVADIRESDLFEARIEAYKDRERRNRERGQLRSDSEIIHQEKLDILRSIYSLAQLQDKFNISIYLHKELPFIRFEITDDLFVMSFLNRIATGKKHPITLVYNAESVFIANYKKYVSEVEARSYKLQNKDLTIDGIMDLANQAGVNCIEENVTCYHNSLVN